MFSHLALSLVLPIYITVFVHCQSHTPFQPQSQRNCWDSKLEAVATNTQAMKEKQVKRIVENTHKASFTVCFLCNPVLSVYATFRSHVMFL